MVQGLLRRKVEKHKLMTQEALVAVDMTLWK